MNFIFYDTETTGLDPLSDRIVQLAWLLTDEEGGVIKIHDRVIYPDGWIVPKEAHAIHGKSTEYCKQHGEKIDFVLHDFLEDFNKASIQIGHNIEFDSDMVVCQLQRLGMLDHPIYDKIPICTMFSATDFCKIPGKDGYKWPRLTELYKVLFNQSFENAHDAMADVLATKSCFFELGRRGVIDLNNLLNQN